MHCANREAHPATSNKTLPSTMAYLSLRCDHPVYASTRPTCMLVHVTEPAMLVLESDQTELDQLRETLRRRYDKDYLVVFERSAAAAAVDSPSWMRLATRLRESDDEQPAPPLPNLKRILSTAISSTSKDDGWSNLGEVGSYLIKSHAAFDPRDYGHTKLGELVRAQSYVEVRDVAGPTGQSQLWVRLKPAR